MTLNSYRCGAAVLCFGGRAAYKKWEVFTSSGDLAREKELYEKIVRAEPYIFIHDDNIYGGLMKEDLNREQSSAGACEKNLTDNIFDYCTVILNAQKKSTSSIPFLNVSR